MFIHRTHLPQLLQPEHYTSDAHLERERQALFLPGWHCVTTFAELPSDGDFITLELLGRPLIVWRKDGEAHAFLNVCSHRNSMLSSKPCGHMGEYLRCQYHGWEYDKTGNTRKIPDAKSFKPMEQGMLGLNRYRAEALGQLIFVTLDHAAPSLREWLGADLCALIEPWFSPHHRSVMPVDELHECNWKVVVENVLEGYHVAVVHPNTFRGYPDESRCTHEFHPHWDIYRDDYSKDGEYNRQEAFVSRLAGVKPDFTWKHLLRYPNVVFGQMGLFTWCQTNLPLGPGRCQVRWRIFVYPGRPGRLKTWLARRLLVPWGRKFLSQVMAEDKAIYPGVHRGIAAPEHPKGGLISIREERVWAFQRYLLRATYPELPVPLDDAEEGDGLQTADYGRKDSSVTDRIPR